MWNDYRDPLTSLELRKAIRTKFAWPGGYEIFGICEDGEEMCCDCMRREYKLIAAERRQIDRRKRDMQWSIVALSHTAETEALVQCSHCNRVIQEEWVPDEGEATCP